MKFIMYALLLGIISYLSWIAACWACMEGPLRYLSIPWKMAVGVAVSWVVTVMAAGIWSTIYLR